MSRDSPIKRVEGACCLPAPVRWSLLSPQAFTVSIVTVKLPMLRNRVSLRISIEFCLISRSDESLSNDAEFLFQSSGNGPQIAVITGSGGPCPDQRLVFGETILIGGCGIVCHKVLLQFNSWDFKLLNFRSFAPLGAPTRSALTLSSDSDSPPEDSPLREDKDADSPFNETSKAKSPRKRLKAEHPKSTKKQKVNNHKKKEGNEGRKKASVEKPSDGEPNAPNHSVWMLSSDSESCPDNSSMREDYIHHEESSVHKTTQFPDKEKDAVLSENGQESLLNEASKEKSPKKTGHDDGTELLEEEASDKHTEPQVSSSGLPLVLSEKVHRSKALVECEGESIDLSGDMGAVGRIVILDTPSRNHEMFLDLKGQLGQSEAKVEAVMNDFIQLKPQSNVYEAETMVEEMHLHSFPCDRFMYAGILEGFSFDSDDEADKMPKASTRQTDQNEGDEEQTNGKTKGKAEKASGVVRKKGKTAGAKPPKKVRKKAQVQKRTKTKK
ncbi:DNA-binding protein BIN4 [Vitis vinifera]|uniref:DNA-binding protein BIN4 n=1 Tax=Vitis vinifera TaxID=29760 RepID=A0A438FLU9_VITVI|nr:DNA-binding protein BIN4 [Vitis vinifera]